MPNRTFRKVICGSINYVNKVIKEYKGYGYKVVKTKNWPDNKVTVIMESYERVFII